MAFIVRLLTYVVGLTLPLWNGFRVDIDNDKLFLFGYELSYYAGYLFFLFLLALITGFLGLSIIWKRFFCKWVCPHNTFSYLLNKIERKFPKYGKALTLVISIIGSLFMAYSTISFFYDPIVIWQSLIGFQLNKYFFLVLGLTGIYIGMSYKARSSFCKVCPYGIAQQISGMKEKTNPLSHPGVWVTWGTTFVLVFFLLLGWM